DDSITDSAAAKITSGPQWLSEIGAIQMISDFYQTPIVMKRKKRNQALWMNSMSPSNLDLAARIVLDQYGLSSLRFYALGNQGGFSGAALWRVKHSVGDLCLRVWPTGDWGTISRER